MIKPNPKKSYRSLPLIPKMEELLIKMQNEQNLNRKLCRGSYINKYKAYIYVNEIGERIRPNYITTNFQSKLVKNGMRKIRFHDLRHPYVKHTTKKYNSEKQKTQATKMDLIAWVFRFCIFNYSKRSWIL